MAKITLIGAGSVVFAKNLISDILQFPELSGSTITLMDIDPARLETARVMAERVVRKLGVKAKIEATLDRRKAITGANYVICTIQVGGYKPGTVIDFEIPRKFGLLQTIGDTLGVGGVFRGLRTIPKILEIARDIAEVGAPGCTFLNYTNPMAMLCMAADKAVGVPMVGLCHSVQGTSQQLANYAGLHYKHVTYRVAGINHMAFFLDYKYRGKDAYPLLFNLLNDPSFSQDKVRFEMMRRLGYFVTESSEHQSEYNPHFIHHGKDVISKFDIPIDEYLRRCESIISTWKKAEAELIGEDGDIVVNPQTHEYGSFIIHSMETNTPRVIYGNVPNTGLITNLPDRCCVELPVLVDAQGLQPTHIGNLPPQLAAICRTNVNVQELTVEAALTGKREHIYHAVMTDPHAAATLPLDKIWAMCDELIEAHQKAGLLGDFAPTIKNTGRAYAGLGDRVIVTLEPVKALASIAGQSIEFTLTAVNQGAKAFSGKLIFISEAGEVVAKGGAVSLKVAGGATLTKQVVLRPAAATSLFLRAVSNDERVVGREYIYTEPRVLNVSAEGGPVPVEIEFMANKLLKGGLTVKGNKLEVTGRVIDTAVKIDEKAPWDASVVEFFVKGPHGAVKQFFLLPRTKGATVLGRDFKPVKDVTFKVAIDKGGYDFRLAADLAIIGVVEKTGDPFYMDFVVGAGALGDAHGACRVGWNGSVRSSSRSGHYALVTREGH
ncbi:alpha-glucosidase/alpha-galactosidase [Rariglobus hedericola]|uniref:Alpha-glucosidase/alpha-galactosidase n=1 Tax=Rariglobus hedericola TaxID=2597822 RepID=A0A556QPJ4_9BACT|nr:alpha-glucosidase/alpha-galactosidase [Rariglobus hedericola]TSJ78549.1 alpha-glucosidase/alpha-galactosidase [Rariglobus hedericola]